MESVSISAVGKTAAIVSLHFSPVFASHMIAYAKLLASQGYLITFLLHPRYRGFAGFESVGQVIFHKDTPARLRLKPVSIAIFANAAVLNAVAAARMRRQGARVWYVFHEPDALRNHRGEGLGEFARLIVAKAASIAMLLNSTGVLLPSRRAYEAYLRYSRRYNSNAHILPLLFDDEIPRDRVFQDPSRRRYFSFLGHAKLAHDFPAFIDFAKWAIRNGTGLPLSIATRSDLSVLLRSDRELARYRQEGKIRIQHGRVLSQTEMAAEYLNSLCVWNLYRSTMQSGVLPQAFMAGTAVIANRKGSFPEFVEPGVNGEFVDSSRDFPAVLEAVEKIRALLPSYVRGARQSFENTFHYAAAREKMAEIVGADRAAPEIPEGQSIPSWPRVFLGGGAPTSAVVLFLYLVLPNLPSTLSAWALGGGVPHGIFNLECLILGAAGWFLPRSAVFLLLALEMTVDYAYAICFTYRFTFGEFLASLRFLPSMPSARIWAGLMVAALSLACCGIMAMIRVPDGRRRGVVCALAVLGMLLVGVDTITGQNFLVHKDGTMTRYRLVRSPIVVLATWEAEAHLRLEKVHASTNGRMSSASGSILSIVDRQPAGTRPDIVLVVVESWGQMIDSSLAHRLAEAYDDPSIQARYNVVNGSAPFSGLTVPGEARELCQSTMGFGIMEITREQSELCLPHLLRVRGYESTAVHGYLGQMFSRNNWYPRLGFNRMFFEGELHALGLADCNGAFPGICDSSAAGWIGNTLLAGSGSKPRFVYWVTLNSHLPVPLHPDLPRDNLCDESPALHGSGALCAWFRLETKVHGSIEQVAVKANRPTVFVVVGDHAPPFGNPRLRGDFSSTVVPFVMLVPKSLAP